MVSHLASLWNRGLRLLGNGLYCGHLNQAATKESSSLLPLVWVFIAQLVEHCSSNAEAMGLNPVEVPKIFLC